MRKGQLSRNSIPNIDEVLRNSMHSRKTGESSKLNKSARSQHLEVVEEENGSLSDKNSHSNSVLANNNIVDDECQEL